MTPIIIFGGIFSGATTITESAVLAVAYAVVAGTMVFGDGAKALRENLQETGAEAMSLTVGSRGTNPLVSEPACGLPGR